MTIINELQNDVEQLERLHIIYFKADTRGSKEAHDAFDTKLQYIIRKITDNSTSLGMTGKALLNALGEFEGRKVMDMPWKRSLELFKEMKEVLSM